MNKTDFIFALNKLSATIAELGGELDSITIDQPTFMHIVSSGLGEYSENRTLKIQQIKIAGVKIKSTNLMPRPLKVNYDY